MTGKSKQFSLAIVCILCVTLLVSCTAKPFNTLEKFARAYSDLDYNAMIECVDPQVMDTLLETLSLFSGNKTDRAVQLAVLSLCGDYMSHSAKAYWNEQGIRATMTVKEISTAIDGDKATVTAEFTISWSNGDVETWLDTVHMVRIDGKWYITLSIF